MRRDQTRNTRAVSASDRARVSGGKLALGVAGLAGLALTLGGCHWDAYLDPSVVGRWEQTPTSMPILDRLAAIEDVEQDAPEYTEVTEDDLIPQTELYVIEPGDSMELTIFDLVTPGVPETTLPRVDQNGYIPVPLIGRVFIAGLTEDQARDRIAERVGPLVQDPIVSVVVQGRRAQTYTLQGNVNEPGLYSIPSADYRLLEAIVSAGG